MAPKNPENNESRNNQALENNSPQFERDKGQEAKKKGRNIRIGAIACGLAIAAVVAGFVVKDSFKNNSEPSPEPSPQETFDETPNSQETNSPDQQATPNNSPDNTIEPTDNASELTQNPDEIKWFELDWNKQSAELQELNNMTIEEFRQAPLEDRLLYFSFLKHIFLNEYYIEDDSNIYNLGEVLSGKGQASIDDSAQEIYNQTRTVFLIADHAVDEKGNFDATEARKILSGMVLDINQYLESDDGEYTIAAVDDAYSKIPEGQKFSKVFSNSSILEKPCPCDNKTDVMYEPDGTSYVQLTYTPEGGIPYIITCRLVTFTNYAGENEQIWLKSDTAQ